MYVGMHVYMYTEFALKNGIEESRIVFTHLIDYQRQLKVYVCMYVCMYACMYVCVCVYVCVCMCVGMHVYMYTEICIRKWNCIHAFDRLSEVT